jgi:hypothetical protein
MEEYDPVFHSFGGILGSLVIGVLLLANKRGALIWARIVVILGAVIFPILHLVNNNYFLAILQILFSLSLIGLIFGKPKRLIIGFCLAFLIFYSLLEIDGLQSHFSGKRAYVQIVSFMRGHYENIENDTVYGSNNSYSLRIPNANWKKRNRRYVEKDNPIADFWLTYPDRDAHVITIHEIADTAIDNLETLTNAAIKNARDASENFSIEYRDSLVLQSKIVETSLVVICEIDSMIVQYKYGIFLVRNHAIQIICCSTEEIFPEMEREFDSIIESFAPNPDLLSNETDK